MRVFGVDPGCSVTGYSVIDEKPNTLKAVKWGIIKSPRNLSFPKRINFIFSHLSELIQEYNPHIVAIEEVFFAKNAKSALKLGHARAAAIIAAANSQIEIAEYSALHVKQSVVGYGRAEKEQVRNMVGQILNLNGLNCPFDASDALALAICHINSRALQHCISTAAK